MTDHGHREDRRDFALRQSETAQQRQCDDADADVQLKDFWFCKRRRECYLSFGTSADGSRWDAIPGVPRRIIVRGHWNIHSAAHAAHDGPLANVVRPRDRMSSTSIHSVH